MITFAVQTADCISTRFYDPVNPIEKVAFYGVKKRARRFLRGWRGGRRRRGAKVLQRFSSDGHDDAADQVFEMPASLCGVVEACARLRRSVLAASSHEACAIDHAALENRARGSPQSDWIKSIPNSERGAGVRFS